MKCTSEAAIATNAINNTHTIETKPSPGLSAVNKTRIEQLRLMMMMISSEKNVKTLHDYRDD